MAYAYLISRSLDPLFALSIGTAAALTRINREEQEKGHSTEQTIEAFKRRWSSAIGGRKKEERK